MLEEEAKTLLIPYRGGEWFGQTDTLNLYRGCCHGCIYCDSRSACYGVHHFDTVRVKRDALSILEKELKSRRRKGLAGLGAMSDPYNPYEKEARVTRGALELLEKQGFGVFLSTKSALVARDADVLDRIAKRAPAVVAASVTCLEEKLARRIEPGAAAPAARLKALEPLARQGVYTGVLLMPVLPFLEDTMDNVAAIVQAAKEAGARFIYPYFGVTLRGNQRQWFLRALDRLFPGTSARYLAQFGEDYGCLSPRAAALYEGFGALCKRMGIAYTMPDILSASRLPYASEQLSFFR